MKKLMLMLTISLNGIGCGGTDQGLVDAQPSLDAPIDAPPPAFVGRWREVPVQPLPEAERAVLTVGADHSFVTVDPGGTTIATWQLNGDKLTLTRPDSTSTGAYFLGVDRFMVEAGFPVGPVDGIVGTWKTELTSDGNPNNITGVFNADMTVAITYGAGNGPPHFVGTWQMEGASVFLTGTLNGNPSHLYLQAIPGLAVGYPLYERLP